MDEDQLDPEYGEFLEDVEEAIPAGYEPVILPAIYHVDCGGFVAALGFADDDGKDELGKCARCEVMDVFVTWVGEGQDPELRYVKFESEFKTM